MTPQEIIKWLQICATDFHAEECKVCPYNKDDYEAGCGKLLSDAALLLSAAYSPPLSKLKLGPDGAVMTFGDAVLR